MYLCLLYNLKLSTFEAVIPARFWRGSNHLRLKCVAVKLNVRESELYKYFALSVKCPEDQSLIKYS